MWACKNGDLDQIKEIVEKPVRDPRCFKRIILVMGCVPDLYLRVCGFALAALLSFFVKLLAYRFLKKITRIDNI